MKKTLAVLLCSIAILATLLSSCSQSPDAERQVERKEITITLREHSADGSDPTSFDVTGYYTGTIKNNVPEGTGKFEATNKDGAVWYYDGDFENGTFDGTGTCVWPESDYSESGRFSEGLYYPLPSELYAQISTALSTPFEMSSKSIDFIKLHTDLFPATDNEASTRVMELLNLDLTSNQLAKDISPYLENIYYCGELHVIETKEQKLWGHTVTYILAIDNLKNVAIIYYDGSLPEVLKDSRISLHGLPIGTTSFGNIGGGTTVGTVFAGCMVEEY